MNCEESQSLLSACIDGELTLSESKAFEQHQQACPTCQAEWASQLALRCAIQKNIAYFYAPAHLENRIRATLPHRHKDSKEQSASWLRAGSWLHMSTVFASVAALAFSLGFYFLTPSASDLLAQDVVASHVRSLMVDHLADVSSTDQHTVKPWFNGKLDFAPTVQDFSAAGFPLVGGRLDYLEQRPVAALVYRYQQHLINVYIWPAKKSQSRIAQSLSRQGYSLAHWSQEGMTYWIISDLNPRDLTTFASLLQRHQ